MSLRLPLPRLLPTTIFALSILLAVKAVDMARLIMPAMAAEPAAQHAAAQHAAASNAAGPRAAAPHSATAEPSHGNAVPPPIKRSDIRPPVEPAAPPPAATAAMSSDKPEAAPISDQERALLLELRQRRQELDGRDTALASREAVLAAAEHKLTARIDELQALQARLEGLETARKARDGENWHGLVKLYESMKPRDAAAIFNDLDMPVLLQVVDRMKEAKAAVILAAMQPDKARQVTANLAQMRVRSNAETSAASGG